jgi:hypothetical protein
MGAARKPKDDSRQLYQLALLSRSSGVMQAITGLRKSSKVGM